jgi:hypothetical protein
LITPNQIAKTSEDSHCIALMQWCALEIKNYPQLRWLTHIPNGGARDIREGAKFKAMGVKRGFPDYFLAYPKYGAQHYCGIMIEMKVGSNKASEEQLEWLAYLNEAGYKAIVCYGWEEARDCIMEYLNG